MSDLKATASGVTTRSTRPRFFCTSGPLAADRPGYIDRPVDEQLLAAIAGGTFVNLTAGPLSGKTSLLLKTAARLREQEEAPIVALIELRQLTQREGPDDLARWLYAIAFRLARQLRVSFDLQTWWADNAMLTQVQRLFQFFSECTLALPTRRLVIMFDDIDEVWRVEGGEQLLSSIRLAFDARAADPSMARLSIVMAGNGDGQFTRLESRALPYAIATALTISPFSYAETLRLSPALGLPRVTAELAMQRIFDWVAGQPATTQYLAHQLAQTECEDAVVVAVDRIVATRFGVQRDRRAYQVLLAVEAAILQQPLALRERILLAIGKLAKQKRLLFDPEAEEHDFLLRYGIANLGADGYLGPANRLTRRYFSAGWANRRLPLRYAGILRAAAVVLLMVALPLWYQIYLPRPAIRQMTAAGNDIASVMDAHDRLARWPGYADDARRIATMVLHDRAETATSATQLEAIAAAAELGLGDAGLANRWRSQFWRERARRAALRGDRAAALHASVEALVSDSPENRRRVSGLLGDDLPLLSQVVQTDGSLDAVRYSSRDNTLQVQQGARISSWPLADGSVWVTPNRVLNVDALASRPLVMRQSFAASPPASALLLSLTLQHERPSDLSLTIVSPSAVSVRVALDTLNVQPGDNQIRLVANDAFAPLLRGTRRGEWTLAISDTLPGAEGSVAMQLRADDLPSTPLSLQALPDPLPAPARTVALSSGGRWAVVLPDASGDLASVWDVRAARRVASFPAAAEDRWLGFANGAREVLIANGATLRRVSTRSGKALAQPLAEGQFDYWSLSEDARWLALRPLDSQSDVVLIDTRDASRRQLRLAADYQQLVIADDGERIASIDERRIVSVWRTADASLLARYPLDAAVNEVSFSPSGDQLVVRLVGGALLSLDVRRMRLQSLWDGDRTWQVGHDRQSGVSLLGAAGRGFRLHDFSEGRDRSTAFLGFFTDSSLQAFLRLPENLAWVVEPTAGRITVWRPSMAALPVGERFVREAWLSPDGQTFAFADRNEHFAVLRLDAGNSELDVLEDRIGLISHSSVPNLVRFSADGRFALSIEASGLFRIRDLRNGAFFDFIGRAGNAVIDARFSASGDQLLILRAGDLQIFDAVTGQRLHRELREVPMTAVATARGGDGWLLVDADGQLFRQQAVRAGQPVALQPGRRRLPPSVDALYAARDGLRLAVLDEALIFLNESGDRPAQTIRFGHNPDEVVFSADQRFAIVRAGQWLHRLAISPVGVRVTHSRLMSPAMLPHHGMAIADPAALRVSLLSGLDEPVVTTIDMDYGELAVSDEPADVVRARWAWLAAMTDYQAAESPSSND